MRKLWVVIIVALAVGWASPAGAAKPTKACKAFVGHADDLVSNFQELVNINISSLSAIQAGDVAAINANTSQIGLLTDRLNKSSPAYKSSRSACLAGK